MGILGRPQGVFSLHDSDRHVGSLISREDAAEVLGMTQSGLESLPFTEIGGLTVIDERILQTSYYKAEIPDAPAPRVNGMKVSLDERVLARLIRLAYPDSEIEHQLRWGRRSIDLKVTVNGTSKFIEFHGPDHFAAGRYGFPDHPSIRQQEIQEAFGTECVIWPYWIQRCTANVRAVFEPDVEGLGVLWSTTCLFGSFAFPDSAQLINTITDRFRARRAGGVGYFYGPNTEGRDNPEHPIVDRIRSGKKAVGVLLPPGHTDPAEWLPAEFAS